MQQENNEEFERYRRQMHGNDDDNNRRQGSGRIVRTKEKFALRSAHKTAAPKGDAIGRVRRIRFVANAIDCHNRKAVGNGVSALHCHPAIALTGFFVHCIAAFPAYGSGIYENFGTA